MKVRRWALIRVCAPNVNLFLVAVAGMHAHVTVDTDGNIVRQWRETLGQKFTKLPGICSLHDFVIVKHIPTGDVIMRVRELCYTGSFDSSKMKIARGVSPSLDVIPKESSSYKTMKQCHELSTKKMEDLKSMYAKFICRTRWPEFLQEL